MQNMNNMNMPMHVSGNPVVGANPNIGMLLAPGPIMQQPSPQQMQPGPSQPQQEKIDNISKVKSLMNDMRESVPATLKLAAQMLHQNLAADSNGQKQADTVSPSLEKHLEDFYSMCDQMEVHLRTAITCIQQAQSATHYMPLTVIPTLVSNQENALSYPAYLNTVRLQISYAKDIHDMLVAAAQNMSPTE